MQSGAAVVVGGELNGLGVCRSLGQAGVATYMVDRKRLNPAMWSRYARPLLVSTLHGPELIDTLLGLQIRLGQRLFLAITDEMAVLAISAAANTVSLHEFDSAGVMPVRCRNFALPRYSASRSSGERRLAAEPRR